jgi:hypothetical protein
MALPRYSSVPVQLYCENFEPCPMFTEDFLFLLFTQTDYRLLKCRPMPENTPVNKNKAQLSIPIPSCSPGGAVATMHSPRTTSHTARAAAHGSPSVGGHRHPQRTVRDAHKKA